MDHNAKPTAVRLLEQDFIECRSRLLDIAAFLDRIDRYAEPDQAKNDFRYVAISEMLRIIASGSQDRTSAILTLLSDLSPEPLIDGSFSGKAIGAWRYSCGR